MSGTRAFFIGRFQPFHKGHLAMVKRILQSNDELVIGIGSAQYSHTGENPFTGGERYEMIKRALDAEGIHDYHIVPIPDTHVHSVWVTAKMIKHGEITKAPKQKLLEQKSDEMAEIKKGK